MNKAEKFEGCLSLLRVASSNLQEVRDALLNDLKILFKALEITDSDFEKIEDPQLYKIALDLDYNAHDIKNELEDLSSLIKSLEKLNI